MVALALEESHRHSPYGVATAAEPAGDGWTLTGSKCFVLDGHVADKLVVAARTAGNPGESDGITLFLVDRGASGVEVARTKMVDSRNAANIELKGVSVGR